MDKGINILVVDDDQAFRLTISGVLKKEGYSVSNASDGYEAIKIAKENQFDIIFMDIKMPGINGVDAYIEIKKHSPKTAVIIMTGYSQEDLLEKAKENGAYAILNKPLDLEYIISLINQITKPVILVVDDMPSERETLKGILEKKDFKVETVKDGYEAIERVKHNDIDIILLDVRMPILDGIKTFEMIHEYNSKISVILMTAYSEEENLEQAIKKGAYTYIYKPIDIGSILEIISKIRMSDEKD